MAKIEIKGINFTRAKPIFLPILALGLIYLSFRFLLKPRINTINYLFNSIKKEEEELSKLTQKSSFLKSLNEAELVRRSELVLQALPEEKRPMYIMRFLRQLCAESGVVLGKISVDPGQVATSSARTKMKEPSSLVYSLALKGTYDQISDLIKRLEITFPLVRIEAMSLSGSSSDDDTEVVFEIASYFIFLPESLGELGAPIRVITEEEKRVSDRLQEFSSPVPIFDGGFLPPVESGKENPFI